MKKILLAATAIMLTSFSCEKEARTEGITTNSCHVANPAQDLPWIRDYIQTLTQDPELSKYFYVQQATYNGQTVFIYNNCCPYCNSIVPVYDCNQNLICTLTSDECPDFYKNLKNIRFLTNKDKLVCQFK